VVISIIERDQAGIKTHDKSLDFDAGRCIGLVWGISAMASISRLASPPLPTLSCQPPELSTVQVARIIVRFLETHPELLHYDGPMLAVYALQDAFPCPAPATPPTRQR
jgi:hypothetical protein